jgi:2-polyprenyl-3-methyl-5-hydroxy-6-metoxy-1,4-benzoquinol methylase
VTGCRCECYSSQFDEKHAIKDLKRYRAEGPDRTTRLLLDLLEAEGIRGASVLDVGGGVGVVHHELLAAGAQTAVHVDATAANIRAAEEEATRRGHAGRVRFLQGDYVALAPEISPADVVTLDRVICCYPDMERLVAASADHARRLYGAVFPRERWFLKLVLALGNFVRRLRGNAFRSYVHPVRAIDAAIRRQGLSARRVQDTFVWRVAVYSR